MVRDHSLAMEQPCPFHKRGLLFASFSYAGAGVRSQVGLSGQ